MWSRHVEPEKNLRCPQPANLDYLLVKKLFFSPEQSQTRRREPQFWFAENIGQRQGSHYQFQENQEVVQELKSFKK